MNIYVGNLLYDVTQEEVQQAFEAYGKVASVSIIMDKFTGRSKGFAFVEMPEKAEAEAAIAGLNLKELKGRAMTVSEARPREERGGGGGRGGYRGGGSYRGGGGGGRSRY